MIPVHRKRYLVIAAAALILASAFMLLWRTGVLPVTRAPDHAELEQSTLRVFDATHRLCWEERLPPFHHDFLAHMEDKVTVAGFDHDCRILYYL